jgi:small-conductance mechanosensitive channel
MINLAKVHLNSLIRFGDKTDSFKAFQVVMTAVLLLLVIPASAALNSVVNNTVPQQSDSQTSSVEATIDVVALKEDINIKLVATNAQLANFPSTIFSGTPSRALPSDKDVLVRQLHLKELVFIYQGHLARLATFQIEQQNLVKCKNQLNNWSEFTEPSAHPFLRADELRAAVIMLSKELEELETWIPTIEQAGNDVIQIAEGSTAKLRLANEAVEKAKATPEYQEQLARNRDLLTVQNEIALANALGFQIEKQIVYAVVKEAQYKLQLARKQLSVASDQVKLTEQDINQAIKNIDVETQHIFAELNALLSSDNLNKNTETVERSRAVDNSELARQATSQDQLDQIKQARMHASDIKLQALRRVLEYLQVQRDIWNFRWVYATETDVKKIREAYSRISKRQALMKEVHDYIEQQRQYLLTEVTNQTAKEIDLRVIGSDPILDTIKKFKLDQVDSYSRLLGVIESTVSLLERFKSDLDSRFQVKTFSDYLAQALLATHDVVLQVWTFELFTALDTIEIDGQQISGKRSITVGKVFTALAILVIGYWFAARLAYLIEGLAVTRYGMDISIARITRRWILFFEVMLLVIVSMLVVRIPLTVFAFMGGAVAIGAGFGMQNMLKNLISGLMLLFERPFRPGDLVEVGGIRGRVIDIGVRSSHIRDGNGIETLIPNSTFIEQNVTNWTLSNEAVRIVVKIGIAYGSPIKKVNELLLEIADRHGLVEKTPEPRVLFEDFGSDALMFGLYVWVELKPDVSWTVVASDLRHMIIKVFMEHGINMAFQQRDIHIDTSHPLEVRVMTDDLDSQK